MMLVVVVVIETVPPEHSGEVGTSEDHLKNEKLQIQEVPTFRDFWYRMVILKCGDHEFRGLFLV